MTDIAITLIYPDNPNGITASASVNALTIQPVDRIRIKGTVAANWIMDDLYLASGAQDFGDCRVDPVEAVSTAAGAASWSPSTEEFSLDYCVGPMDADQYIEADLDATPGPPVVSFGIVAPTFEDIKGTQVNAWAEMGTGGNADNAALILDSTEVYPFEPSATFTVEGLSAGQIGAQPGEFGYGDSE